MCGLVGIAGINTKQNDNVLQTLLILDGLRGTDSTGIAAISRDNHINTVKAVGNPYELLYTKQYDRVAGSMNRAIIGHNRFATQGAVNKANAHPFELNTLVGAHNGTLNNKWELADHKDFTVDSENLYHHMEKHGLEHLMGVIRGAWSLTWWNKDEETLNFLRNKERPMFITFDETETSMYWASESWMLDVALARQGVKRQEIVSTEEDVLYSFYINEKHIIHEPAKLNHPSRAKAPLWPITTSHEKGGKVHFIPKKPQPSPKKETTEAGQEYTGEKGRSIALEVLTTCTDSYGADYYICFDSDNPEHYIRLYKKREDLMPLKEGSSIICDIMPLVFTDNVNGKIVRYFKVIHSSVVPVEEDEPENSNVFYEDPKGKKKNTNEWLADHGTCSMCTGLVDPAQNFRFTIEGESICHECVADPRTSSFVAYR